MAFLSFALTYPFIWVLSRLPMRFLYFLSDIFFFILFYIVGYRKKVIYNNIYLAFPNKTETEKKQLAKKFFKHFVDLVFESIKAFSISEEEIKKRYKYTNPELVNDIAKKGKSIALVGAHQANWEWSFSLPLPLDIAVWGAYTKLGNKYFDNVIFKSRTKFGVDGFKTTDTVKGIQKNIDNNIQALYILLSDQSPQIHKTHYWSSFLGVKVPMHTGAEMLAKKFDLTVINYVTKKVKRGYFETTFELITENPNDFDNYEITDRYIDITERNINEQPEFYLWSHKRFKHMHRYDEWLEKYKK